MIDFRSIEPGDRTQYLALLEDGFSHGCEFSFANLFLWGRQKIAFLHGQALLFSQFDRRSVYPFPVGRGDKAAVLDAVIADARERGIACRITGLDQSACELLEKLYPGQFLMHCDRGSFDYVYDIDDLADLPGKRYHRKRNHLRHFWDEHPNAKALPLDAQSLPRAERMVKQWFEKRLAEDPNADFRMEQVALARAFAHYGELCMDGILLCDGDEVLAVTMGNVLDGQTFDVQFEKARWDVDGAYAAVNCEFARYLRKKYPELRYLDREEDMGLEGLRKAKLSYYPHHMIEKCWAHQREDGNDY